MGSWATAKRVAALYGTENLTLLFADGGGASTPRPTRARMKTATASLKTPTKISAANSSS
ncbi:PAPS reductase [Mycobacterium phage DmpstrDiver]|nr:PAPS reductase [Mycobacterium phage DmpstrDiver]